MHSQRTLERVTPNMDALSTVSSLMLRVSGSLSAPMLKPTCLCRMDALTSLSISLHAAARHVWESMGGHPRWLGDLPSGLCNLPKLTELDLSFRAFRQAELNLPQVCASQARQPAFPHGRCSLQAETGLSSPRITPGSLLHHQACRTATLALTNACIRICVSHAGLHAVDIFEEAEAGLLREGAVPPGPGQRHAEAAG